MHDKDVDKWNDKGLTGQKEISGYLPLFIHYK